jgi:cell division protein FtsA
MSKEKLIAGLDIGTSKIRVLIVGQKSEDEALEPVFQDEEASVGVRNGTVIDPRRVSEIIQNLFYKAHQDTGQKIDSVYVNYNGSHLFSVQSHGLVSVSRANQIISKEDVKRVLGAARAISLPSKNREIFDYYPKEFIVDTERGIKNPEGLQGVRLEVDILALGGFSSYLKNTRKAVMDSGLDASDLVISPIAAARAVLTERQKELGVALLDIGAGISSLTVYEEGSLIHFAVIPMASRNITGDIAIALKTRFDTAERIKIEQGTCIFKGKDKKQEIETEDGEPLTFSGKFLVKVISERLLSIFGEAGKELEKISKEKTLPAGIVLTGAGSKLPKIVKLAKDKFNLPVIIGKPKGILGISEDIGMSTVCGLALLGSDAERAKRTGGSDVLKSISSLIKKGFKIFIP